MGLSLGVNASPFYDINADSKYFEIRERLGNAAFITASWSSISGVPGFSEYEPLTHGGVSKPCVISGDPFSSRISDK